jgi:hypothetical protein
VEWNVGYLSAKSVKKAGQLEMIEPGIVFPVVNDAVKIGRQSYELRFVFRAADERELMRQTEGSERLQQIADVSSYTEIADSPGVNCNFH